MPLILPAYPEDPQHVISAEIEGVAYRLRYTWRDRTASWYLDVFDATGAALIAGRRLSPGAAPLGGITVEGGPGGLLYVRGIDDFERADLGGDLAIALFDADELAGATVATVAGRSVGGTMLPAETGGFLDHLGAALETPPPVWGVCAEDEVTEAAGVISAWGDAYGPANLTALTGTAPTLRIGDGQFGGRACVRLDAGALASVPLLPILADCTLVVIAAAGSFAALDDPFVLVGPARASGVWLGRYTASEAKIRAGVVEAVAPYGQATGTITVQEPHVYTLRRSGATHALFVDALEVASKTGATTSTALGTATVGSAAAVDLRVAAILLFDYAVPDFVIKAITATAAAYYGIAPPVTP